MLDFSLRKWYLDIADNKGNVYIGYLASLKWGKFKFNGFHHLWRSSQKGVETQIGIGGQISPEFIKPNQLILSCQELNAAWEYTGKAIKKTLFNTDKGKIVWRCVSPKARAHIKSPNLSFSGLGYAEMIDITVPVWGLPFKTLYWGRCHTDSHYLIWIKWDGRTKRSFAWLDGKICPGLIIENEEIRGKGFKLKMGKNIPLRQGIIASTVFKQFGKIVKLLPEAALSANENKWYNKGLLETDSKSEMAITIYEKVLW